MDNILLYTNGTNLTYKSNATFASVFALLDSDMDGWINFADFGNFIQIVSLFTNLDTFNKGRIVAGDLYEGISKYSNLPVVSLALRVRANRFSLFPPDLYFDMYNVITLLRLDDIVGSQIRRLDKTTMYEYELKNVLNRCAMSKIPDPILNNCLRGVDARNIPLYDWECSFLGGIKTNLNYFESSYAYMTVKKNNLTMTNTVFVNSDVQLG